MNYCNLAQLRAVNSINLLENVSTRYLEGRASVAALRANELTHYELQNILNIKVVKRLPKALATDFVLKNVVWDNYYTILITFKLCTFITK